LSELLICNTGIKTQLSTYCVLVHQHFCHHHSKLAIPHSFTSSQYLLPWKYSSETNHFQTTFLQAAVTDSYQWYH